MPNQATWVVVANGSHAKLFRVTKFPKIEEFETLEHPTSRLKNQDLVSSKPGRTFDRISEGRSAYESAHDPHHIEIDKFARILATRLADARQKNEYSRLYLMASPPFLGLLRDHIDHATQETIVAEVSKDLTDQNFAAIENHLESL